MSAPERTMASQPRTTTEITMAMVVNCLQNRLGVKDWDEYEAEEDWLYSLCATDRMFDRVTVRVDRCLAQTERSADA